MSRANTRSSFRAHKTPSRKALPRDKTSRYEINGKQGASRCRRHPTHLPETGTSQPATTPVKDEKHCNLTRQTATEPSFAVFLVGSNEPSQTACSAAPGFRRSLASSPAASLTSSTKDSARERKRRDSLGLIPSQFVAERRACHTRT